MSQPADNPPGDARQEPLPLAVVKPAARRPREAVYFRLEVQHGPGKWRELEGDDVRYYRLELAEPEAVAASYGPGLYRAQFHGADRRTRLGPGSPFRIRDEAPPPSPTRPSSTARPPASGDDYDDEEEDDDEDDEPESLPPAASHRDMVTRRELDAFKREVVAAIRQVAKPQPAPTDPLHLFREIHSVVNGDLAVMLDRERQSADQRIKAAELAAKERAESAERFYTEVEKSRRELLRITGDARKTAEQIDGSATMKAELDRVKAELEELQDALDEEAEDDANPAAGAPPTGLLGHAEMFLRTDEGKKLLEDNPGVVNFLKTLGIKPPPTDDKGTK